jgi:hypothetical protein
VIADVVTDVSTPQKGRLSDVNNVIQWPLKAVGDDHQNQFDIAIQQGDRSVARKMLSWLAGLV